MRFALPILRLVGALLLLLTAGPLPAQSDKAHARYRFQPGGKAQVRLIVRHEWIDEPSAGFRQLRDSSSTAELLRLSQGPDLALRVYAAFALVDRGYPQLAAVFAGLFRHDQPIRDARWGRDGRRHINFWHVTELVYFRAEQLRRRSGSPADSLRRQHLSMQLDSVVLDRQWRRAGHLHRSMLNNAAHNRDAYPGSYALIRRLYQENQPDGPSTSDLAEALATYQRPEDVGLLLADAPNRCRIAARFPAPAFWPLLAADTTRSSARDEEFYRAVAAYRHAAAARLLDSLYHRQLAAAADVLRDDLSELATALTTFYYPGYDSLSVRLWERHRVITPATVARLPRRDSAQAARIFARGLLNQSAPRWIPSRRYYDVPRMVTAMLLTIRRQDSAAFRRVVLYTAGTSGDDVLTGLCTVVRAYRLRWPTAYLLANLQVATRPADIYLIAQTLLDLQDQAVTAQLRQALATKPDEQYANWRPDVDQLLQARGLPPTKP